MQISEGQKDKIKKVFESDSKSIIIRVKFSDLYCEDVIAFTKSHVDRLVEEYEEKKGMTIRLSETQLTHNMKIEGGIFTSVSRINSIPNWNCLASFMGWRFVRNGEHVSTKTNWK